MSRKQKQSDNDSVEENETSTTECACNVGEVERVASAIGGGLLVIKGLKSGSIFGLAIAAIGAAGLYRAASGHCPLYKALKLDTNTEGQKLSAVATQLRQIGGDVAGQVKTFAADAAEKVKSTVADAAEVTKQLSDDARNKISDTIAPHVAQK